MSHSDVSVIISTYNSPLWLGLVIEGYFCQSFSGSFEILIADDGSTEETAKLIRQLSARSPVPIRHVWQPDQGFQKCRILNKAIAVSRGKLLLFTDGDCIPQANMLNVHFRHAKPGIFQTGGYLKLPEKLSAEISILDVKSGICFRPAWLVKHGFPLTSKLLKLIIPAPFDEIANRLTPTKRTWNGHNSSCYRDDAFAVNGFNEQMQYGGEDVEFGLRLNHLGIRGRHLRFSTLPIHLYHQRGYVEPGMIDKNRAIIKETIASRAVTVEHGLNSWIRGSQHELNG